MLPLMIIALAVASTTVVANVPQQQQQPQTMGLQVTEEMAKALLADKRNEGRVVAMDISPSGVVTPASTQTGLRSTDAAEDGTASPNQRCWFFFPPPPPPPPEYAPNQPNSFYSSYYPNWYSNYFRYPYYSYYGRRPNRRPTQKPGNNNSNNNDHNADEELPMFNPEGQQQFPNFSFNQGGAPNFPGNFPNGQGPNFPANYPNFSNQQGGVPNFPGFQGPNFQAGGNQGGANQGGPYAQAGTQQDSNARY